MSTESIENEKVVIPDGVEIDDPVRMYLKEIGRVRLLTANEEIDLAQLIEGGDEEAKRKLVEANLRLGGKHCQTICRAEVCFFWI